LRTEYGTTTIDKLIENDFGTENQVDFQCFNKVIFDEQRRLKVVLEVPS